MATINYNGMELEEFSSDKSIFFEPPKKCVVWFNPSDEPIETVVYACDSRKKSSFITISNTVWPHCAILPDPPKPRRATNRELSRWLAQGKGECMSSQGHADTAWMYEFGISDVELVEWAKVRKWSDTEWHEPTVDYLFGGDDD